MNRAPTLLVCLVLGLAAACEHAPVHAVVYENFSQLAASPTGEHYHQFAERGGAVVDVGCFVVQRRQLNCFDAATTGQPNLHLAVVECECPCASLEPDPCDATRPLVRSGAIRGLVDEEGGSLTRGGVETPTPIDLADASGMFITRRKNDSTDPLPGGDVVLGGQLVREGGVLRGTLVSPGREPTRGLVAVVPVVDGVSL